MPFRSEKQRRYLFANEPEVAHRWAHEGSPFLPSNGTSDLGLTIPSNPWIRFGVPLAILVIASIAGRKQIGKGIKVAWDAARVETLTRIAPSIVRPYIPAILEAADRYSVGVFQLIGLGSRESGWGTFLKPRTPAGVGDPTPRWVKTPTEWMIHDGLVTTEKADGKVKVLPPALGPNGERGWGFGLMQADYASNRDWIKSGRWKDPRANILKGAEIYAAKIAYLTKKPSTPWVTVEGAAARARGVAAKNYPDPRPLSGDTLLRAALAAYNTGELNVLRSIAAGVDPDRTTTGGDYSRDVVGRGREVATAFQKAGGTV